MKMILVLVMLLSGCSRNCCEEIADEYSPKYMDEACLGIPLYFMPACRDEMSIKYPELAPKLKWDDSM